MVFGPTAYLIGRGACVLAGAAFIYVALFMYEQDEGRLHNRLEEWWIRLDDTASSIMSRQAAFCRHLAQSCNALLDALFGHRLLSMQSAAVTACISAASIDCVMIYLSATTPEFRDPTLMLQAIGLAVVATFPLRGRVDLTRFTMLIGSLCMLVATSFIVSVSLVWLGVDQSLVLGVNNIGFAMTSLVSLSIERSLGVSWMLLLSLPLSIVTLLIVLPLQRVAFRHMATETHTASLAYWLVCNGILVLSVTVLPLDLADMVNGSVGLLMIGWAFGNAVTAAVMLGCGAVALIMLLHRALWPAMEHAIYAMARHQLVRRSKLLFAIGLSLLGVGGLSSAAIEWMAKLARF